MEFEVNKDERTVLIYDTAEYEEDSDIVLLMYLLDSDVNFSNINLDTVMDIARFRKDNKGKLIQFAGDLGRNRGIELGSGIEVVADKIAELRGKRPNTQKLKTSEIEKLDTNEGLVRIDEILGTNYVELYKKVRQNSMGQKLEQEDSLEQENTIKGAKKRVYLEEDERRKKL